MLQWSFPIWTDEPKEDFQKRKMCHASNPPNKVQYNLLQNWKKASPTFERMPYKRTILLFLRNPHEDIKRKCIQWEEKLSLICLHSFLQWPSTQLLVPSSQLWLSFCVCAQKRKNKSKSPCLAVRLSGYDCVTNDGLHHLPIRWCNFFLKMIGNFLFVFALSFLSKCFSLNLCRIFFSLDESDAFHFFVTIVFFVLDFKCVLHLLSFSILV